MAQWMSLTGRSQPVESVADTQKIVAIVAQIAYLVQSLPCCFRITGLGGCQAGLNQFLHLLDTRAEVLHLLGVQRIAVYAFGLELGSPLCCFLHGRQGDSHFLRIVGAHGRAHGFLDVFHDVAELDRLAFVGASRANGTNRQGERSERGQQKRTDSEA